MRHDSSGASTREFPQHSFVYSYGDVGACHVGDESADFPAAMPSAPVLNSYSERDLLLPSQQQQQQQQHQQQQQYPFPPSAYYVPPPRPAYGGPHDENADAPSGCFRSMLTLVVFHVLNAALGIAAFTIVITAGSLAIGLLPLCCFGIVVFRVMLPVIRFMAILDVKLCNLVSDPSDRVVTKLPQDSSHLGMSGQAVLTGRRLAPRLGEMSPLALLATLYFATIKFALGVVSCVVASLFVAVPASVAAVATGNSPDIVVSLGDDPEDVITPQDDPLTFTLVVVCLFVISLALLHLSARLSCAATRFFFAEKFTVTQFYFSSSDVGAPGAAPVYAASAYGATG